MGDLLTLAARSARLASLTTTQGVWLALACAERLASADEPRRRAELRATLDVAWDVLRSGEREGAYPLVVGMETRDDADDDPVAATLYALQAVIGSSDAVHWGADRALDNAFERVPYPVGVVLFRPLHGDTGSEVVQEELRWQMLAADFVCGAVNGDEVKTWARQAPDRAGRPRG